MLRAVDAVLLAPEIRIRFTVQKFSKFRVTKAHSVQTLGKDWLKNRISFLRSYGLPYTGLNSPLRAPES